jgi:hypothetical protein
MQRNCRRENTRKEKPMKQKPMKLKEYIDDETRRLAIFAADWDDQFYSFYEVIEKPDTQK